MVGVLDQETMANPTNFDGLDYEGTIYARPRNIFHRSTTSFP